MTARLQKRLAIAGAVLFVGLVLAANAQLLVAAIGSQPECVASEAAATPAKRAC